VCEASLPASLESSAASEKAPGKQNWIRYSVDSSFHPGWLRQSGGLWGSGDWAISTGAFGSFLPALLALAPLPDLAFFCDGCGVDGVDDDDDDEDVDSLFLLCVDITPAQTPIVENN